MRPNSELSTSYRPMQMETSPGRRSRPIFTCLCSHLCVKIGGRGEHSGDGPPPPGRRWYSTDWRGGRGASRPKWRRYSAATYDTRRSRRRRAEPIRPPEAAALRRSRPTCRRGGAASAACVRGSGGPPPESRVAATPRRYPGAGRLAWKSREGCCQSGVGGGSGARCGGSG